MNKIKFFYIIIYNYIYFIIFILLIKIYFIFKIYINDINIEKH